MLAACDGHGDARMVQVGSLPSLGPGVQRRHVPIRQAALQFLIQTLVASPVCPWLPSLSQVFAAPLPHCNMDQGGSVAVANSFDASYWQPCLPRHRVPARRGILALCAAVAFLALPSFQFLVFSTRYLVSQLAFLCRNTLPSTSPRSFIQRFHSTIIIAALLAQVFQSTR